MSNKDNESGWSVVVLRVVPDKQNVVHNWNKVLNNFSNFLVLISERQEKRLESLEILGVLVGFSSSNLNVFLELAERSSHCRFVLLKELKNLLNTFLVKLLTDRVQVS